MNNIKIKAIHINTDYKFIYDNTNFEGVFFDNTIIILEDNNPYDGIYRDVADFYKYTDENTIIEKCNQYDLVVLYGLSLINQKIALRLNKEVKIAWRFFGYELYEHLENLMYSEKTIRAINSGWQNWTKSFFKSTILKEYFKVKKDREKFLLERVIKRVNYFLCLSEEEYIYLKKHFHTLPQFVKLPFPKYSNDFHFEKKIPYNIILGHNTKAFNNHIDILDIIDRTPMRDNYEFLMLFSYGGTTHYSKIVRKIASQNQQIRIIEDFMTGTEFTAFYQGVSAFVLNAHREIAVGNVYYSFLNGVKVYLNRNNVILDWLRNEGFVVFTIEDFVEDLENNNIILSEDTAYHNYIHCKKLSDINSIENFQKRLYDYLYKKTNL